MDDMEGIARVYDFLISSEHPMVLYVSVSVHDTAPRLCMRSDSILDYCCESPEAVSLQRRCSGPSLGSASYPAVS